MLEELPIDSAARTPQVVPIEKLTSRDLNTASVIAASGEGTTEGQDDIKKLDMTLEDLKLLGF